MRTIAMFLQTFFAILLIGTYYFWQEAVLYHLEVGIQVWPYAGYGALMGLLFSHGKYWYEVGQHVSVASILVMLLQVVAVCFCIWYVNHIIDDFIGVFVMLILGLPLGVVFGLLIRWLDDRGYSQ